MNVTVRIRKYKMKWVGSLSEDCKVPEGSCDMINDSDPLHTEAPG